MILRAVKGVQYALVKYHTQLVKEPGPCKMLYWPTSTDVLLSVSHVDVVQWLKVSLQTSMHRKS